MAAPESDIGKLIAGAIAQGVGQALQTMGPMTEFPGTGSALLIGQEEATFGGSIAQANAEVAMAVFEDVGMSPGWGTKVLGKVLDLAKKGVDVAISAIGYGPKMLVEMPLQRLAKQGIATPDKALGNMGEAFGTTTFMGLMAMGISDLAGLSVLGTGGIPLKHIAALVAGMGGWDVIYGNVWGPFMRGYVGQPMRYWINDALRPFQLAVGDILRMRNKRLLKGCISPAAAPTQAMPFDTPGTMPGYEEFKKLMAYQGFSDEDILRYEDDLYREPSTGDMRYMAESKDFPEQWWWTRIRRMGFNEQDTESLVKGSKRMLITRYLRTVVTEMANAYRDGIILDETLEEQFREVELCSLAREYAVRQAKWRKLTKDVSEETMLLTEQFNRDRLTLEEYRAQLSMYYQDPKTVKRKVALAEIKRYKRIAWTTQEEDAQRAFGYYRQLFLAGRITEPEYQTKSIEAGILPVVFDAMFEADLFRRSQTVLTRFQKYDLPHLRDQVLHGTVSFDEYRRSLIAAGFPEDLLEAELNIARTKFDVRLAAEVRSGQLPSYRQAYVVGLIGRGELRYVMQDAGLDKDAITAQMLMLDRQRDAFLDKLEDDFVRQEEKEKELAESDALKVYLALQKSLARARGMTAAWIRTRSESARKATKPLAERLIKELQKGNDASGKVLYTTSIKLRDELLWAQFEEAAA